jgi:hypothetical protein
MEDMKSEFVATLRSDPEDLWLFLDEPELQKQWMRNLVELHISGTDRPCQGAGFRMRTREGRRVVTYLGEITAHDRPHHLAVRFWGGSMRPGMAVRVDYRLTPEGALTRLDITSQLEATRLGLGARLLLPLAMLLNRLQMRASLRELKRLAEAQG